MVDETGLVAVLDWEFAHVCRPGGGPRVAARPRVAVRPGRAPPRRHRRRRAVPRALCRADGRRGPARRAARVGGARQLQVGDRRPQPVPPPSPGRGAQRRARDPRPPRGGDGARAPRPDREGGMSTDRPNASELATAVREFLEAEILPMLDRPPAPLSHARRDERALDRRARGTRADARRTGRRPGGSARATFAPATSSSCGRRSRRSSRSRAPATWTATGERAGRAAGST